MPRRRALSVLVAAVILPWATPLWATPGKTPATRSDTPMATPSTRPADPLQSAPLSPARGSKDWRYGQELSEPLWSTRHAWKPRPATQGEEPLAGGARIDEGFADPDKLLATAYDDLRTFLRAGGVGLDGPFVIRTVKARTDVAESFHVEVTKGQCVISAGDTEGIRRGIVFIEDQMLRAAGPFLTRGQFDRRPVVRLRIAKNPLTLDKIPPLLLDELCDEVDYYPDAYLNRLAHEGVNGLWFRILFSDLCRTSITPEFGKDADRRLAKLRRMIEKCRRYGVKIYLFGIEPYAWAADSPILKRHPELGRGGTSWEGRRLCCPFSEAAQTYLYEAMNGLFKAAPGLGGYINISLGERSTTCVSGMEVGMGGCPVCSKKKPWETLHSSLSAMEKGMHDADPSASFISWLYLPREKIPDWTYDIVEHTPKGVISQINFDSGVQKTEFGKVRTGGDYWMSTAGPSDRFRTFVESARKGGAQVSAKIQTGCSHEIGSVPFIPVPGQIYKMFKGMHELNVSASMLCWQFGNYPSVMYKAAGELAFAPLPDSEEAFLKSLARIDWGADADTVARAWQLFGEAFSNYPLFTIFQYYGPLHDGVAWPLLLEPRDARLGQCWLTRDPNGGAIVPPSGDRIGECIHYVYTLDETIELCRRMADTWDKGVALLDKLAPAYADNKDRLADIGVARALAIQFRSGLNVFRFYDLRERMLRAEGLSRLDLLAEMKTLVRAEIAASTAMIALCEQDGRLGFNASADGYKYHPARLRWRIGQLQGLLTEGFPRFEQTIRRGELLCPAWTGREPAGPRARAIPLASAPDYWKDPPGEFPAGADVHTLALGDRKTGRLASWAAFYDRNAVYLVTRFSRADMQPFTPADKGWQPAVTLRLEPRRLWPSMYLQTGARPDPKARLEGASGATRVPTPLDAKVAVGRFESRAAIKDNAWWVLIRMPLPNFEWRADAMHAVRINVQAEGASWRPQSDDWPSRLAQPRENPAQLGWLTFDPPDGPTSQPGP